MLNQKVLDGLVRVSDWPRVALYRARWGLPIEPGVPDWYDRNGTENHKIEYVAASVLVEGTAKWFNRINDTLDRLLKWHNWDEQCSAIYDTYYLAAVCVFDHCAKRDGYPNIREKCKSYFQNTVNLWSAAVDGRGRVILPGKRTSDRGWDQRRDQCLRALTGQILKPWSASRWSDQANMEVGLVLEWAAVEDWEFEPEDTDNIGLMDPVNILYVPRGFIATTNPLRRCAGFPCWAAWSVNDSLGSVSWKNIGLKPGQAKLMGSGRAELNVNDFIPNYENLIPRLPVKKVRILL